MRLNSGAMKLIVEQASDVRAARHALEDARQRIFNIPHPDEPTGPYASWISDVEEGPGGFSITIDMADAEVYPGVLEEAVAQVVDALEDAGLKEATISFPDDLRQRVGEAIKTGLVPRELHHELMNRIARGERPAAVAAWLAAESEARDSAAYDSTNEGRHASDKDNDAEWAGGYAVLLAIETIAVNARKAGLTDSETLARILSYVDTCKDAFDALP